MNSLGNCVGFARLADARIFPAINLLASGTRKEELLYTENENERAGSFAEAEFRAQSSHVRDAEAH